MYVTAPDVTVTQIDPSFTSTRTRTSSKQNTSSSLAQTPILGPPASTIVSGPTSSTIVIDKRAALVTNAIGKVVAVAAQTGEPTTEEQSTRESHMLYSRPDSNDNDEDEENETNGRGWNHPAPLPPRPSPQHNYSTPINSQVPEYASACSGPSRYSSACSCWGVTPTTIFLPTSVTTITIGNAIPHPVTATITVTTRPSYTNTTSSQQSTLLLPSNTTMTSIPSSSPTPPCNITSAHPSGTCNCTYTKKCYTRLLDPADTNNTNSSSTPSTSTSTTTSPSNQHDNPTTSTSTEASYDACALLCDQNGSCAAFSFQHFESGRSGGLCVQLKTLGFVSVTDQTGWESGVLVLGSCRGVCARDY